MKGLLERLKSFVNKHRLFTEGSKIGVAVSGGPDSVFLLHLLYNLKEEFKLNLVILHFNHKIRKEATRDELFVKNLSNRLNVPILTGKADVVKFKKEQKLSLEEAARIKRYEFFEESKIKLDLDFVATGHTKDDFIETLLMNMLRGSSIDGLVSLKPKRGHFIRPILDFTKNEIETTLKQNNIPFVLDKTNMDTLYTRNRIRHKLIPVLEEINPNIKETLFKLGMTLLEDSSFINDKAELEYLRSVKFSAKKATINTERLNKNPAILKRVVSKAVKKLLNTPYSLSYNNLERLKETVLNGTTTHIRGHLKAKKTDNSVVLEKYENQGCTKAGH